MALPKEADNFDAQVDAFARMSGVPRETVLDQIGRTESAGSGGYKARGPVIQRGRQKGASPIGKHQVMPNTVRVLGPFTNVPEVKSLASLDDDQMRAVLEQNHRLQETLAAENERYIREKTHSSDPAVIAAAWHEGPAGPSVKRMLAGGKPLAKPIGGAPISTAEYIHRTLGQPATPQPRRVVPDARPPVQEEAASAPPGSLEGPIYPDRPAAPFQAASRSAGPTALPRGHGGKWTMDSRGQWINESDLPPAPSVAPRQTLHANLDALRAMGPVPPAPGATMMASPLAVPPSHGLGGRLGTQMLSGGESDYVPPQPSGPDYLQLPGNPPMAPRPFGVTTDPLMGPPMAPPYGEDTGPSAPSHEPSPIAWPDQREQYGLLGPGGRDRERAALAQMLQDRNQPPEAPGWRDHVGNLFGAIAAGGATTGWGPYVRAHEIAQAREAQRRQDAELKYTHARQRMADEMGLLGEDITAQKGQAALEDPIVTGPDGMPMPLSLFKRVYPQLAAINAKAEAPASANAVLRANTAHDKMAQDKEIADRMADWREKGADELTAYRLAMVDIARDREARASAGKTTESTIKWGEVDPITKQPRYEGQTSTTTPNLPGAGAADPTEAAIQDLIRRSAAASGSVR